MTSLSFIARASVCTALACGSSTQTTTHATLIAPTVQSSSPTPTPTLVHEPRFALDLRARVCARAHGKLRCRDGIDPEKSLLAEPVISGLENVDVTSAAFGRNFGCVTTRGGNVMCFGGNNFGQLGAGLRVEEHAAPVALAEIKNAKRVYAGPFHACAILNDGKVTCWGKNQYGENGSATNYLEAARELVEPEIVSGVDDVAELALGWDSTCAISNDGRTSCWGRAKLREAKAHGDSNEAPTTIAALEHASSITANEEAFCAVRDEKVVCWGQLMMLTINGTNSDELTTVDIKHARRVSLGSDQACVVDVAGAVFCFGHNTNGELGTPPMKGSWDSLPPTKVEGIPRAVDVVCGSSMSCAITASDDVWCWGRFDWHNDDPARSPTRIAVEK